MIVPGNRFWCDADSGCNAEEFAPFPDEAAARAWLQRTHHWTRVEPGYGLTDEGDRCPKHSPAPAPAPPPEPLF